MSLLYLLSFLSMLIQVCFLALGISTHRLRYFHPQPTCNLIPPRSIPQPHSVAGIYYLAELVEEYTVATKRLITYIVGATVAVLVLLACFDPLMPWSMIAGALVAQALYVGILTTFPYVQFVSGSFVGAVVMLVANHWLALSFFAQNWHPLTEVLAYFTLCLWPVPFMLLVSLCANDNVLPMTNGAGLGAGSGASSMGSEYMVELGIAFGGICKGNQFVKFFT